MSLQEDLKHDHFRVCKQKNKYVKKRAQIHYDFCSGVSTENLKHSKKCSCQNLKSAQKSLAKIQKQSNTKHIKNRKDNQVETTDIL